MRHANLARTVHGLLAAVILASLVVQIALLLAGGRDANTGEELDLVPVPVRLFRLFSYFTVQSNLFVLGTSLTLAARPDRDGRLWRVLRLDALLGITITGLVYWTLLAPLVHLEGLALATGLGFHLVAPVGAVVVWAVFGPRPRITWATVGWSLVWPVLWIACTFVRGALTGWYPYPFMDASALGYPRALLTTGGVLVLGLLLAVVYRRLDRLRTLLDPPSGGPRA